MELESPTTTTVMPDGVGEGETGEVVAVRVGEGEVVLFDVAVVEIVGRVVGVAGTPVTSATAALGVRVCRTAAKLNPAANKPKSINPIVDSLPSSRRGAIIASPKPDWAI